jgi:hypothetical protein
MIRLDSRHWAWCSLGPLAEERSAIADSHVQGSGICKTTGTLNLRGIYRPAAGSEVSLAYSDGQRWIARLPRRLRVLSSFADPLRGITTASVGCSLAYFEDRKPAVENITSEQANPGLSDLERRIATQSITASFVVGQILGTLGLTAAGSIPFTTSRVVDEWDLSAGYVEELGRIAQSEGYFAWINEAGQVEFISKDQGIGVGPMITQAEIIDLSPQTTGDLPAESVYARYQRLQLVAPDANADADTVSRRNWESEVSIGGSTEVLHTYTDASGNQINERYTYIDYKRTDTRYDNRDRVISRRDFQNGLLGNSVGYTTFVYGGDNEVLREEFTQTGPLGDIAASCGKEGSISDLRMGETTTLMRVTTYDRAPVSGITKTTTFQQVPYIQTPFGADAISKLREAQSETFENILVAARRLSPYGGGVRIRTEREFGLQRRPGQQERNRMYDAKAPTVEQRAEITWAIGSPAAQTTLELSPPYVSDDRIIKTGDAYSVVASDAPQRAINYARIENRLLLANRSGVGVQILPIDTPAKPFSLLYARFNGATAATRLNGTTWTIGADGVVVTSDPLFWGAIDGTMNTAWFPLPPGVTSLPATAAVTTNANPLPPNAISIPSGFNPLAPDLVALFASLPTGQAPTPRATINPSVLVVPWNETISLRGGVRVGGTIEPQDWIATEQPLAGGARVGGIIEPVDVVVNLAAAVITTSPQAVSLPGEPPMIVNLNPAVITTSPQAVEYTGGAELVAVTSRSALTGTGNQFIDWGSLGAAGNSYSHPLTIATNTSTSVEVTMYYFNDFQRLDQQTIGPPGDPWQGNFAVGDELLFTDTFANDDNPLSLSWSSGGSGFAAAGTQIQSATAGAFTARVTAYDASGTSMGYVDASGVSNSTTGTAVFIGIRSTSSANPIYRVDFSIVPGSVNNCAAFAINQVEFNTSF